MNRVPLGKVLAAALIPLLAGLVLAGCTVSTGKYAADSTCTGTPPTEPAANYSQVPPPNTYGHWSNWYGSFGSGKWKNGGSAIRTGQWAVSALAQGRVGALKNLFEHQPTAAQAAALTGFPGRMHPGSTQVAVSFPSFNPASSSTSGCVAVVNLRAYLNGNPKPYNFRVIEGYSNLWGWRLAAIRWGPTGGSPTVVVVDVH